MIQSFIHNLHILLKSLLILQVVLLVMLMLHTMLHGPRAERVTRWINHTKTLTRANK